MEIKDYIMNECMKNILREMEGKLKDPEDNGLRASNSGSCTRKIWYENKNVVPDLLTEARENKDDINSWIQKNSSRARYNLVFGLGNMIETQLVDILGDKISDMQKKITIQDGDLTISGSIDGIYTDEHNNKWIVDFKSINTRGFKQTFKYRKSGTEILVDYKYICQAHCYMKALDIPRFIFIYYNKDTSHIDQVGLTFNEITYKEIIKRFKKAIGINIPDRDYHPQDSKDGWNCTYCQFFNTCWAGEYKMVIDSGVPKAVAVGAL